jgi:hypothetical protein
MRLVDVELVEIPYLAEGLPHLFDDLHLFERRLQRFGGCADGLDRRMTSRLGGNSCLLPGGPRRLCGLPQLFPLLTDCLERLSMVIAHLTRFFCQSPELLRCSSVSPRSCSAP